MKEREILKITETAVLAALAIVLHLLCNLIPFLSMPQGGSVSLGMLPIIVLALRRGIKYGVIGGVIFGFLNFMTDGFIIHWGSIFMDYLLACGLLGLAGLFKHRSRTWLTIIMAVGLAGFLKYLCHSLSGVLFFTSYAEEMGYNSLSGYFYYSFIFYNLPYMAISTVLSILVAGLTKEIIFKE
jgi:thiamine transporter